MSKIIRYGLYEAKIFFRVKTAVFYSIIFPAVLLLLYYAANYSAGSSENVNGYFPYLVSITMISTAGGLATLIVNNRVYNMWKFYNFFGYKTWQMTVATSFIYLFLSEVICLLLTSIMFLGFKTVHFSGMKFLLFAIASGLGTVVYLEIAVITGLCVNDPRNAQTIINGLIYLFVILSGSIFRFNAGNILGNIIRIFPNIHIGNLLHDIWNYNQINWISLFVVAVYMIIFMLIIWFLIEKERKKYYIEERKEYEN